VSTTGTHKISVVIATRNRRHQLEGCLGSLAAQKDALGEFELVVVNDGSLDDTEKFLDGFRRSAPMPVTVLSQSNAGVATARNRGIAAASGAIIGFTDDDCLLADDWISQLLQLWNEAPENLAGIGGPLDTVCKKDSLVAEYLRYLDEFNHLPVITSLAIRPRHKSRFDDADKIAYLRTSNASFRADALHQIGGFDGRFRRPGGEDPDLSYRLLSAGFALKFSPKLHVDHLSRADFHSYFGSLENYVRGEFINRSNRGKYPAGPIRRTYSMIPLQKVISLAMSVFFLPLAVFAVAKSRGRLDRCTILFPVFLVASKLVALRVAVAERFHWV
jgi:O-antigen biosynthesis protein